MNDNEINIAIAEAVKWKPSVDSGICWDGNGKPIVSPPSYTTDLNAMHEAERSAFGNSNLWHKFVFALLDATGATGIGELDGLCCIAKATARQRAEAFLRTLGKWKD